MEREDDKDQHQHAPPIVVTNYEGREIAMQEQEHQTQDAKSATSLEILGLDRQGVARHQIFSSSFCGSDIFLDGL